MLIIISVLLASCSTIEIPNFKTYVTLPASGNGHSIETITHKQEIIPKEIWDKKKPRAILLFSEDWEILKKSLIQNCLTNECKQSVGALDGLFFAIDDALKKLDPKPRF